MLVRSLVNCSSSKMDNRDSLHSLRSDDDLFRRSFAVNAVNYNSVENRLDSTINSSVQMIIWSNDSNSPLESGSIQSTSFSQVLQSSPLSYEPYSFANSKDATSYWGTVFHLYMISAGPALLNMPRNYLQVGYFLGFLITLLIFFFYWYNMRMLIWTEYQLCVLKQQPNMSYSETLFHAFQGGPPRWRAFAPYSRHVIHILYLITWIGAFNLVLIAKNLKVVYQNVYNTDIDVHVIMMYVFIPMLFLTWIHRLKYLIPLSIIGNAISVFCIAVVIYHIVVDSTHLRIEKDVGSTTNIPVFLGSVLFNLNATGLMMPLKNQMSQPSKFNSNLGVLTVTYFPMSFLFAFFGLFCCLKYGNNLQDTVIQNLELDESQLQIMILLHTAALALQYPLITYVAFDTLWNNILIEKQKTLNLVTFWEYIARTVVYIISYAAAYTIPNLNLFLSISGTIGTAVDSLIFPAFVHTLVVWKLHRNEIKFKVCLVKNIIFLLIALLLLITGLTESVNQVFAYYNNRNS